MEHTDCACVNLLGDNTDTITKNTETLIDASKQFGLEVNTEKTKYMLLYRHQDAEQDHDINTANSCFEIVAHFKYFGNDRNKSKLDSEGN
jgi:hypothetical protein